MRSGDTVNAHLPIALTVRIYRVTTSHLPSHHFAYLSQGAYAMYGTGPVPYKEPIPYMVPIPSFFVKGYHLRHQYHIRYRYHIWYPFVFSPIQDQLTKVCTSLMLSLLVLMGQIWHQIEANDLPEPTAAISTPH